MLLQLYLNVSREYFEKNYTLCQAIGVTWQLKGSLLYFWVPTQAQALQEIKFVFIKLSHKEKLI